MKRIFIALSLLCVPLLAFSENKIKMVTYFPVPYVAYSKINASKQLDIGLTSACEMNLGCSESGALGIRPLQATTVNLNRGKLDLNTASAVKSTNVTLGSGSGEVNIDFATNLRIGTLNNGYSLEATDMNVSSLTLFRSHMSSDSAAKFPSCAATGASGAPQVSWQKVKLKKAEEVYLVCGTPKVSGCDASSKPSTPSPRTCNTCGTQSATVSCNESTGQWQTVWGSCSVSSSSQCGPACTWTRNAWLSFSESWSTAGVSSVPYYGCTSSWQKSWSQLSSEQQNSVRTIASKNSHLIEDRGGESCTPGYNYYGDPGTLTATCTVGSGKATLSIKFQEFDCQCSR